MEIKMCRFQRSDCFEWLQFVLEAALPPALSVKHTADKARGDDPRAGDGGWCLAGPSSICCSCAAAEPDRAHRTQKCCLCSALSGEGEEPVMCQNPLDFHPFGWDEAGNTETGQRCSHRWNPAPGRLGMDSEAPWLQCSPHHSKNWATLGGQNEQHSSHWEELSHRSCLLL